MDASLHPNLAPPRLRSDDALLQKVARLIHQSHAVRDDLPRTHIRSAATVNRTRDCARNTAPGPTPIMDDDDLTVDELENWLLFGAHWRMLDISRSGAEVEFCTCTGEPLERRRTRNPQVIEYLRTAHPELDSSAIGPPP
jgi:hypothetical protein